MRQCVLLITLSTMLLCMVCTPRQHITTPPDPDEAFEQACSNFDHKKYNEALQGFERILFYHPTSEYVDDAQYWLARTYFEKKEFAQATAEFDYLIKNFSTSPFIEDAYFYRAKAYFLMAPGYAKDPTELENAIDHFDRFLTIFPNSAHTEEVRTLILDARNRLARKELENGKLYVRLGEANAALLYFNYILKTYPETEVSSEAKFLAAEIYEKNGAFDRALALYQELLTEENWRHHAEEKIHALTEKSEKTEDNE